VTTRTVTITYRRGDPRQSVTFVEQEFPEWPITLHYVLVQASNGATDFFNVGLEIGKFEGKPDVPLTLMRRRIDPAVVKHVMGHYADFERRARTKLETGENVQAATIAAPRSPRRRREMTPERLQMVAAEFEGYRVADRSPLAELARDYGVNPSTVSRWIVKAREAGYIDKKETTP
jgi:transposase-like protein